MNDRGRNKFKKNKGKNVDRINREEEQAIIKKKESRNKKHRQKLDK